MDDPARTPMAHYWPGVQAVLEDIFTAEWLASDEAADHPARADWEFAKLMQSQNGSLSYPSQRVLLAQHGRLMLDVMTWIGAVPESSLVSLRIGDIEGYGDERVAGKLMADIRDSRAYGDWLVELMIAGVHRAAGRAVTPYEQDRYPDLRIDVAGGALLVECKRLYAENENSHRKVIQNANAQVKNAADDLDGDYDGSVVLDLNGARRIRFGSSEWTPPDIEQRLDWTQRALSGEKNRSIRRAYVVWDDYSFHGDDPGRTLVAYLRRCAVVEHTGPARGVDLGTATFEGSTTASLMFWTPKNSG
jgi:hypothetical protein